MAKDLLPQKWENNQEFSLWRFKLMTSDAPAQKLSVVQEIFAATIAPEYKAYLLLDCLRDDRIAVREAAQAGLQCLGVNARILLPLKKFLQGDAQAIKSLEEICSALGSLDGLAILLALAQFLHSGHKIEDEQVFRVLQTIVAKTELPASLLENLLRTLVDDAFPEQERLYPAFYHFFLACVHNLSATAYSLLWEEVHLHKPGKKQTFLLRMLGEIGIQEQEEELFFSCITDQELKSYLANPQGTYGFEHHLLSRSTRALPLLCKALVEWDHHQPAIFLEMVERIASKSDVAPELMNQVCQALLLTVQNAGVPALQRILWGALLQKQRWSAQWRTSFAREVVRTLVSKKSVDEFYGEITAALVRLGEPAMLVMQEFLLSEGHRSQTQDTTAHLPRCLREVIMDTDDAQLLPVSQMIEFVRQSLTIIATIATQPIVFFPQQKLIGEWAILISYLLARYHCTDQAIAGDFSKLLLQSLWKFSGTGGVLQALSELAISSLAIRQKSQIIQIMIGLLQRNWDIAEYNLEKFSAQTETQTTETQVHLYWLPALLDGAWLIWQHLPPKSVWRRPLLDTVHSKWRIVTAWQEIWSPHNSDQFLHIMGQIGAHVALTMVERQEMVAVLLAAWEQFPPSQVLAAVLPILKYRIPKLQEQCVFLAEKLLASAAEDDEIVGSYQVLGELITEKLLPPPLAAKVIYVIAKGRHLKHEEAQVIADKLIQSGVLSDEERKRLA